MNESRQQIAVLQVVIIIKLQQEAIYHRTIAVQRKAIHMTHTMMAMMIYTWMTIMIMTGIIKTAIMLTA